MTLISVRVLRGSQKRRAICRNVAQKTAVKLVLVAFKEKRRLTTDLEFVLADFAGGRRGGSNLTVYRRIGFRFVLPHNRNEFVTHVSCRGEWSFRKGFRRVCFRLKFWWIANLAGLIGLFLLSDISEKPFCVELKLFLFRLVRKEKYYRVLRLPFLLY